ncbi:MAG: CPBP family glutamic-type intramembrane protease [Myxococcota bacterium]
MKRTLTRWMVAMAGINLVGLGCVAVTWALAGGQDDGMGPYLLAVGRAATSLPDLAWYCLLIAGYSALLEVGLRVLIQEPLLRRSGWVARLSIPVAALAYGLTHAVYHPAGVAYAVVLGLASAGAYAWLRDWRALAVWHVQWNALAIGGALLLAMTSAGAPRSAVLVAYKADRIESGTLEYRPRWGWTDTTHTPVIELEQALEWAQGEAGDPWTLTAYVVPVVGPRAAVTHTYALPQTSADPEQVWTQACTALMDFNERYERAQADQPWWTGAQMSAFQFDDLPSVLRACLDAHPDAEPPPPPVPTGVALERWQVEGWTQVARPHHAFDLPESAVLTGPERSHLAQLQAAYTRAQSPVTVTRRERSPSPTGTITVNTP